MRKQHKQETWPISTQKVTIPGRSRCETRQVAGSAQSAYATAHLCQWLCSLAAPRYSQMDHRTERMDIFTGGWRKDPPKIISKHSEGMWWRKYMYLASWTIRRIPFPNNFGVISSSKQFKVPVVASEALHLHLHLQEPSGDRTINGFTLPLQKVQDRGRVLSQFAKATNKGSVEGSPLAK